MTLRLGRLGTFALVFLLGLSMLAVGLLFTRDGPVQTAAPAVRSGAQPVFLATGDGDLSDVISGLQRRLVDLPEDHSTWASLGTVYVQQAAVTGDPSYYAKAEGALAESLQLAPDDNAAALTGQATLAAARHDFDQALRLGRQSQRINPYSAANQAILTDALQQLGDYRSARTELQTMLDLQPGVPSFTRASYTWELEGQLGPARDVLRQALDTATRPSDQAYCLLYLGELAWNEGRLVEADRFYREGLRQDPAYTALSAGRAKVAAARGDVATAVARYEKVVRQLPVPTYLIAYADLLRSLGRHDEAARQEAVIEATRTLFEEQGVDVDLEIALYDADRGRGTSALLAAQALWERQRSVDAADAYAWALHVAGRNSQALRLSDRAARLGTRSALFAFHRGMIERDLGRTGAARASLERALDLNPDFSPLLAPRAEAALANLGPR